MRLITTFSAMLVSTLAQADRYAIYDEGGAGIGSGKSLFFFALAIGLFALFTRWPARALCVSAIIAGVAIIAEYDGWIIGLPLIAAGGYFLHKLVFVLRVTEL